MASGVPPLVTVHSHGVCSLITNSCLGELPPLGSSTPSAKLWIETRVVKEGVKEAKPAFLLPSSLGRAAGPQPGVLCTGPHQASSIIQAALGATCAILKYTEFWRLWQV